MKKTAGAKEQQNFAGRLKSAAQDANIKQNAIAAHFDVSEQAVSQWFRGETEPDSDRIFELARLVRVQAEWLQDGTGPRTAAAASPETQSLVIPDAPGGPQEFIPVGRFDAAFSMGAGSLIPENPEPLGYWIFESQWLRAISSAAPDRLAVVKVDGDSMAPTFHGGDLVLVDRSSTRLNREGIYAITVGDTAWVKRISLNLKSKKIRVLSDNPLVKDQPELDEEELSVVGRVIALVARKIT